MAEQDPLHQLSDEERAPLEDHLSRLRHDLGKYVSMQVRWLGGTGTPQELHDALAADLLETRRGPRGSVDAPTVWAEFRPGLVGEVPLDGGVVIDLTRDTGFGRLDAAMAQVAEVADAMRRDTAGEADVTRGIEAAKAVSETCRSLWTRVRGG